MQLNEALGVSASCGLVAGWWVGGYCSDLVKRKKVEKNMLQKEDETDAYPQPKNLQSDRHCRWKLARTRSTQLG